MCNFLTKRPMLLSALLSGAISVGFFYVEKALFIICAVILAIVVLLGFKRVKGELILAVLTVLAVAISLIFASIKIDRLNSCSGTVAKGEYIVIDTPVNHGEFYSVTLETAESEILPKGSKLAATYEVGILKFSQIIKADISVSSLESSKYKKGYYSQKIYLSGHIKSFEQTGKNDPILKILGSIRSYIKDKIFKYYKVGEAATMLALLTGDRSYFTDKFYNNVKCAGVAHVMVVSGMHLSVIVSLFLFVCNKLFYNCYLKAFIIFLAVVAVATVCGFTMSILRAGITYILIMVCLLLNRQSTPENTLGGAVVIILIFNPLAIFSVAFQLSVLSTVGILVVALPVIKYISERKIIKSKILLSIVTLAILSVSALILTAPVVIYIFGYISNVSVITNLLISSAVTAALNLCIMGFAFPFLEGAFFKLSEILVAYVNNVINYFGSLPFATTVLPKWTSFLAVSVIIAFFWILLACKRRKDMIKLEQIENKRIKEAGVKPKWQSFMRKRLKMK